MNKGDLVNEVAKEKEGHSHPCRFWYVQDQQKEGQEREKPADR